jgi:hypothetical protein
MGFVLELIGYCQKIHSLTWTPYFYLDPTPLVSGLKAGQWPYLEKLGLGGQFKDTELAVVIESLSRPLRALSVQTVKSFGHHAIAALINDQDGRHRASLESFKWIEARRHFGTGTALSLILSCFPKLKVFHAPGCGDLDIYMDPRPWVCTDMRDFQVPLYFALLTHEPEDNPFSLSAEKIRVLKPMNSIPVPGHMSDKDKICIFIDRLAAWTRLETLSIGHREPPPKYGRCTKSSVGVVGDSAYHTLELAFGLDASPT